jgi:hypothetical protein
MKWRLIENEWNLKNPPWAGAIGIEEDDVNAVVPAIICWFTRGWEDSGKMAQEMCDQHNRGLSND